MTSVEETYGCTLCTSLRGASCTTGDGRLTGVRPDPGAAAHLVAPSGDLTGADVLTCPSVPASDPTLDA
nr:hypothetical protein OG409_19180 [Streptomyces sp. NBC_00974]